MKKFFAFSLVIALIALVGLTVANYTYVTSLIEKATQKDWKTRYDNAVTKLEERVKELNSQIIEWKVKERKKALDVKESDKGLEKSEKVLVNFYSKMETVSSGEFEFCGTLYTTDSAKTQKLHWLSEIYELRHKVKLNHKELKEIQMMVSKLEELRTKLSGKIGELRRKGEELATKRKIAQMQEKIRKMEMADSGSSEKIKDPDMSVFKKLVKEADNELMDLKIRAEVQKEEAQKRAVVEKNAPKSLKDVISTTSEENYKDNTLKALDKEFSAKARQK